MDGKERRIWSEDLAYEFHLACSKQADTHHPAIRSASSLPLWARAVANSGYLSAAPLPNCFIIRRGGEGRLTKSSTISDEVTLKGLTLVHTSTSSASGMDEIMENTSARPFSAARAASEGRRDAGADARRPSASSKGTLDPAVASQMASLVSGGRERGSADAHAFTRVIHSGGGDAGGAYILGRLWMMVR